MAQKIGARQPTSWVVVVFVGMVDTKHIAVQPLWKNEEANPYGPLSLGAMAQKLAHMGLPTITGEQIWPANTVKRLRDKLGTQDSI